MGLSRDKQQTEKALPGVEDCVQGVSKRGEHGAELSGKYPGGTGRSCPMLQSSAWDHCLSQGFPDSWCLSVLIVHCLKYE